MKEKDTFRIIDANLNRLREALRVCEEVTRFIIKDKNYTAKLKRIRHRILTAVARSKKLRYCSLVLSRDSRNDVGKGVIPQELKRKGSGDILNANLQRTKESLRVLEEFSKVMDCGLALEFKKIRFKIYSIEKVLTQKRKMI